jgi:hypothetical protein
MNMKEAYYRIYDILDEYWDQVRLDDLGNMLSDLSPYTFKSEYVSADPAGYADWKAAWERIVGADRDADPGQVYIVACTILDYYTNELGYNLGESRDILRDALGLKLNGIAMVV